VLQESSLPLQTAFPGENLLSALGHSISRAGTFLPKLVILVSAFLAAFLVSVTTGLTLTLGEFNFNDAQFGDTLTESDNGVFRQNNWLNVKNVDPGNPGALTGANVNTGIGNIGLDGPIIFTIGYNTPIVNGAGSDLGIISARFSADQFGLAVSTDGVNFTPFVNFGPKLAISTNVEKDYFYGNAGETFHATLFVTPVDLSLFGISQDTSISAVEITAMPEGDLIRVAGLAVPEPCASMLTSLGICALGLFRRRRSQKS
jgi:hypothetical protein